MSFQLKKASTTFDFDLEGKVKKAGVDFGKWSTTDDEFGRIVVTKTDGTQDLHDAIWKFEKNQLCLFQGTNKIFNFQKSNEPGFTVTDKAVLKVQPIAGKDFSFVLNVEWDLTSEFDLSLTHNKVTSVIDGFIENEMSLFEYWFTDNEQMYRLTFTGTWQGEANLQDDAKNGSTIMRFHFPRKNGSLDEFSLPLSATFDSSINQFVYKFEKADGVTNVSLNLNGLINIGKDSKITYSIGVQKMDGVEKTFASKIEINALLVTEKIKGEIKLKYAFLKNGTETKNVLSIGGNFKFDKASLQILFQYSSAGKTRNVFFGGKLTLDKTGTTVLWSFKKENNVKTLSISVTDAKVGKANVSSELVITTDDGTKKKAISFILGVTLKI